jgi:acetyl esterase/lipase
MVSACAPVSLLNGVSRLAGDGARLAANGARFGDDPRQRLDVWMPAVRPAEPLPTLVFFYGGGWISGERGHYGFAGRAFAARGFVTVIPDYRLYPDAPFPDFVDDGARAGRWVQDHIADHGGDPSAIALAGHSAGAYNAAMLALDRHFLADAGVDPAVVRAAALLSGPFDFYPFTTERGEQVFGRWPRPLETQPVHFVRADAPPMLLAHGTADTTCLPANSQRLAAALDRAGASVELKLYRGKSHTDTIKSLSPVFRGATPALADSIAFLRRHLG